MLAIDAATGELLKCIPAHKHTRTRPPFFLAWPAHPPPPTFSLSTILNMCCCAYAVSCLSINQNLAVTGSWDTTLQGWPLPPPQTAPIKEFIRIATLCQLSSTDACVCGCACCVQFGIWTLSGDWRRCRGRARSVTSVAAKWTSEGPRRERIQRQQRQDLVPPPLTLL